jgi:hypothetical protein
MNWLGGSIPAAIGRLRSIESMYVCSPCRERVVLASNPVLTPFRLSRIRVVLSPRLSRGCSQMNDCGLEGEIPPTLASLPRLQNLVLADNALTGSLDVLWRLHVISYMCVAPSRSAAARSRLSLTTRVRCCCCCYG